MSKINLYNLCPLNEGNLTQSYWDTGHGACGCIFIAKDTGRILLSRRSSMVDYEPNTWGTWGGKIDEDESVLQALDREVEEETGFSGRYKVTPLWTYDDPRAGFKYYNYLVVVPEEFRPELNWESSGFEWCEWGDWPEPLHFGMIALLKNAGHKIQSVVNLIRKKNAEILEAMDTPPPPPPAHIMKVDRPAPANVLGQKELMDAYIVAATVWGEARGEGPRGQQAVLNVIMNRSKNDFSNARGVVLKRKQFSMWNNISNPEEYALSLARSKSNDKIYKQILQLVDAARTGRLPDITKGATHYYNPELADPVWGRNMDKIKIGKHVFGQADKKKL
ncbi:MAG TPA: cell wall hydrolase [Bacteroidales bacterium]|nr:cell wall hydrolase [Bacteroidales bacterium]